MASRAAQVRDAVADAVRAAWSPTAPDGVTGLWAKDVVLNPDEPDLLLTGRQVYVFASAMTQPLLIDRDARQRRYVVGVVVAERHLAPGEVPAAWVDERVEFVETNVLGVLADPALKLLGGAVRLMFDEEQGIDSVCDRELLQQNQTFWSVATFVYQEAA